MLKHLKKIVIGACLAVILLGGFIFAGTITPPSGSPSATTYSLEDIYNKITNAGYSYSSHNLGPDVPTNTTTMHSLSDIYNTILPYRALSNSTTTIAAGIYNTTTLTDTEANLIASNIASGTEMFGITGTFVCTP